MRRFFLSQLDGEATANTLTTVFFSEQNNRENNPGKTLCCTKICFHELLVSQKESFHLDKKQFYMLHLTTRRIVAFIMCRLIIL